MAYLINSKGVKINIEQEQNYITEKVVSFSDDTVLKTKYILNLFRRNTGVIRSESEFITEILFTHKPTTEEIMYHLAINDISRYDGYATVEEIYMIDFSDDY